MFIVRITPRHSVLGDLAGIANYVLAQRRSLSGRFEGTTLLVVMTSGQLTLLRRWIRRHAVVSEGTYDVQATDRGSGEPLFSIDILRGKLAEASNWRSAVEGLVPPGYFPDHRHDDPAKIVVVTPSLLD